jgi:hypothetical protein
MQDYANALDAIYAHVGFVEDWVVYPIDDQTKMFWSIMDNEVVRYAETPELLDSDGEYYESDIYTQRFYKEHVYRGEDYTMIFTDSNTDGMKYFSIFDNQKEQV